MHDKSDSKWRPLATAPILGQTPRFKAIPADFKWQELTRLMKALDYQEIQGNGSRVKFENGNADQMINLHRPHPGNIVKRYALRQLLEKLVQRGLI